MGNPNDVVMVLLDAKDIKKAVTQGIVKGLLTVTALNVVAKFVLGELKKKEAEKAKKTSEVKEVTDEE